MGVGFEFATGWEIFKMKPNSGLSPQSIRSESNLMQYTTSLPKGAVLKRGVGWQMTADGTEIEYVVNDAEESEEGLKYLKGVMADLATFMGVMNLRKMQTFLTASDFPKETFLSEDFVIYIKPAYRFKAIEAIPQVTGGVRLARIRKLWRLLADPNSLAAKQFFSESRGGAAIYSPFVKRVVINWKLIKDSRWPNHQPSAALRGLVTLIATYLDRGYSPTMVGVGAVKYLYYAMSRTSFSGLFKELPPEERNHYINAKEDWVRFICVDVMSKIKGMPTVGLNPKGKLIERTINDRRNLKVPIQLPITREDWLKGMLEDKDLLSADAHPLGEADNYLWEDSNKELGHRLRGLAGLGDKMDNLNYKGAIKKAAIIEFRARQAAIEYTHWPSYAYTMHKFFTEINEGDRHGLIDIDAPSW